MKKIIRFWMGLVLLSAIPAAGAAKSSQGDGISTPVAATPVVHHKAGKTRVKTGRKKTESVWVCPMGDYSGPKTKDGRCPHCGMGLVEKK